MWHFPCAKHYSKHLQILIYVQRLSHLSHKELYEELYFLHLIDEKIEDWEMDSSYSRGPLRWKIMGLPKALLAERWCMELHADIHNYYDNSE